MVVTTRIRQRLAPIVLSVLAATLAACAEHTGPTAADLALDGTTQGGKADSGQPQGQKAIRGRVFRFSGEPRDTIPNDTLGTPVPVTGALVEACYLGPLPTDTVDTIAPPPPPPDSGDTIRPPVDTSWMDSLANVVRVRAAADAGRDSAGGGRPPQSCVVSTDRTDKDGNYVLDGLASGIYRVSVTLPGSRSPDAWTIAWVGGGDTHLQPFFFPPRR